MTGAPMSVLVYNPSQALFSVEQHSIQAPRIKTGMKNTRDLRRPRFCIQQYGLKAWQIECYMLKAVASGLETSPQLT
jgi:hypothetical protein